MKVGTLTKRFTLGSCLFALLFTLFLSACGGPESSDGPVELTLWTYPSAGEYGNPPDDWFLTKKIREELNIDLKVTFVPYGDDGDTKFNAAAAGDNMPDLFQIPFNNNIFLQWVNLGLIAPVDDLLPLMPKRTADRYSDPQMQQIATINGKRYVLQEKAGPNKRQGLFIRQDWLDKLGLEAPKTLDEFLEVAKAFTTQDPDGNGKNDTYGFGASIAATMNLGNGYRPFFGAFGLPGIWNFNKPGEISLSIRDPQYMKAVEFLHSMVEERVIDPDWATLNGNDFRARWKQQGQYGIISEDFCAALCITNYPTFDTNFPDGEWVPLAPPAGPDGKASLGDYNNIGLRIAVSQKAVNNGKSEAIAKLLEWMHDGEGYYLTAFGQEGEHYTLDANGNVTVEGAKVPFNSAEAAPLNQLRALVYNQSEPELKSRYPDFKTQNGRNLSPIGIYNTLAGMPWEDHTATYIIQPASNQNDINRYIVEGLTEFISGKKEITTANWDAFIKGLDNLNVADWEAKANETLKTNGFL